MTLAGRRWSVFLSLLAFAAVLFAPHASACDSPECKLQGKKAKVESRAPAAAKSAHLTLGMPGLKSPVSLQPSWYTDPSALEPGKTDAVAKVLPVKAREVPTPAAESDSFRRLQWFKQ